jgi:hypothetical protein
VTHDSHERNGSAAYGLTPLVGASILVVGCLLIYALYVFWNGWDADNIDGAGEARFALLIVLAGALGSFIDLAGRFTRPAVRGSIEVHTVWSYVLRIPIGMVFALLVCFGLRGVLLTGSATLTDVNVFGMAAAAGVAGLFAGRAVAWLRAHVEESTARPAIELRSEARPTAPEPGGAVQTNGPVVTAIDPVTVKAGEGEIKLRVGGSGFQSGSIVVLNGRDMLRTRYKSPERLSVRVPEDMTSHPADIQVAVRNPGGEPISAQRGVRLTVAARGLQ